MIKAQDRQEQKSPAEEIVDADHCDFELHGVASRFGPLRTPRPHEWLIFLLCEATTFLHSKCARPALQPPDLFKGALPLSYIKFRFLKSGLAGSVAYCTVVYILVEAVTHRYSGLTAFCAIDPKPGITEIARVIDKELLLHSEAQLDASRIVESLKCVFLPAILS